jgi:hypothetical protein
MREIKLSQGKVAIVDDADYAELSQHKWYYGCRGYAVRNVILDDGKRTSQTMHSEILGETDGLMTDHINGNRTDNRRCNLRLATSSQNNSNRAPRAGCVSEYKGVRWDNVQKKWYVKIAINRQIKHIGYFRDEKKAAIAYNEAAKQYHGEYAWLNVID